ncbi:IS66 family insertion sequence element accessory protein TnpB [Bradyrhizobium sp. CCBAU 11361]|uniref:IS66 family insertion sequence element accessory protein TnpB n=1 Tax=Bradyrhizobium sp. CCBAU 11361 TaxID=1630812 RepID=UPI003FA43690
MSFYVCAQFWNQNLSCNRIRIVWWGWLCRYLKRLEKARFCWPRIGHHRLQLNAAQLMGLVDGMDWKRSGPRRSSRRRLLGKSTTAK